MPWCGRPLPAGSDSVGCGYYVKMGAVTSLTDGMAAVVFDFFGTLTPVSPSEAWASNAARLAVVFGVPPAVLLQVLDDTFPERISGTFGDVRQTMQAIGDRLGLRLSEDQLSEASRIRRAVQEAMFALRPEATGVISTLRERGLHIGLVSDCTSELPDAWHQLPLAALIDAPVFSCVERTRKPDPRLFHAVAQRLHADPAACLYIGDGGGRELTGASGIGMRAVLLAGPDWHAHRDHNKETDWAGPRVSSLLDLLT
jgi:putative hydrolase of the HAD superfamily